MCGVLLVWFCLFGCLCCLVCLWLYRLWFLIVSWVLCLMAVVFWLIFLDAYVGCGVWLLFYFMLWYALFIWLLLCLLVYGCGTWLLFAFVLLVIVGLRFVLFGDCAYVLVFILLLVTYSFVWVVISVFCLGCWYYG